MGYVGVEGGEEGRDTSISRYSKTDPKDTKKFILETQCDVLALAIGNAHVIYKKDPKLDFSRLSEINQIVDVPLVLYGGSGTSDQDFHMCIER